MTFSGALWGHGHARKEDVELVQQGHGAELSISPFECLPGPTLLSREETNNSTGLCALSKVLE